MAITKLQPFNLDTTANYTFANITTDNANLGNAATANFFIGNGSLLTGITVSSGNSIVNGNSNVSVSANGNVTTSVAGTSNVLVITSTGANITGTANISGNLSAGNITTGAGSGGNISGANVISANILNASDSANLGNSVVANYFTGNFYGTANLATYATTANSVAGGNVSGQVGNSLVAGTVYTNAQPNITSVGTLSNLTSTGTVNLTGASNVALGPVANVHITGGSSGQYLSTDGSGGLSWATVAGGSSSNISNGNSNVNIPSANGNITMSAVGNANIVVVTGTGIVVTGTANVSGNLTAGNITTGAGTGGNITGANVISANILNASDSANLGNSVTANYFIGSGANLTSIPAGNISGQVGNALVSGTVYTNAQPNITSVGTLSNLTSTGTVNLTGASNVALGPVGNVHITGGSSGQYLSTDGSGTLSWATVATGSATISNGNSNVNIPAANGNVNISAVGNANVLVITGTGANITGTLNVTGNAVVGNLLSSGSGGNVSNVNVISANTFIASGNITAGNANLGNSVTANYFIGNLYGNANSATTATTAGTVTTAAQPNITSVGTLTSLAVSGTGSFGGNVNLNSFNITSLATPVASTDAATKQYVDDVAQGLNVHDAAAAATPDTLANVTSGTITYNNGSSGVGANLTTTGTFDLIDGVNVQTSGTRILVKNEANAVYNGIYTWSNATVITRATDYNSVPEVEAGDFIFVTGGTLYDNTGWVQTSTVTAIGTAGNNIDFAQFSGAGTYQAGTGLTLTGTTFSVNASQTQVTSVGTLGNLTVSGNATVGNLITSGSGGNLTSINVVSANTFIASGNITAGNASLGNSVTANYFTGNFYGTANLATYATTANSVAGSNVSGQVANALVAGTVYTNAQPNITSVGTLSSLTSTGTIDFTGASNTSLGPVANVHITGGSSGQYLQTDGSGTLSWATVASGASSNISNGNSNVNIPAANGNVNISAVGNANVLVITGTGANVTGTLNVTGNATVGNLITSGSGGNLTNINVVSANTFTASGNITAGNLIGPLANGNSNVNIPAANGNVNISAVGTANVVVVTGTGANIAGTLDVTGNLTAGNLISSGTGGNITNANVISANILLAVANVTAPQFISNVATGTAPFVVTSTTQVANLNVATAGSATNASAVLNNVQTTGTYYPTFISDTSNGNYALASNTAFSANLANGGLIATTFVGALSGAATSATTAGTVTTAAQPNITSVGTLTALTVGPNSSITLSGTSGFVKANSIQGTDGTAALYPGYNAVSGAVGVRTDLTVGAGGTGNLIANAGDAIFGDASTVTITGGTSGQVLSTDGAGNLSWATAGGGSASISNGTSNVNIATSGGNVTTSVGGNANVLIVTGTGANIAGTLNVSGNATVGNLVTGAGSGGSIAGGNSVSANYLTGTLTTAAQPNITSVGSLTGLTVSNATGVVDFTTTANVTLGAVGNLHISGGTSGYVLSTDGSGALSWVAQSGGGGGASISNGTSNVNIATSGGNVTVGVGGTANVLTITSTGANITGTANITGNTVVGNLTAGAGSGGSITGANLVSANFFTGTLTTAAQPNITSLGSLSGLTVSNASGVVNFITTANVSLGAVGNVKITGGTANQFLQTNGSGTLTWATPLPTITDNTSASTTYYPVYATSSSGSLANAGITTTKLQFVPSTGTLTVTDLNTLSDATLKENPVAIENPMEVLMQLFGMGFNWIDSKKKSYGLMAQMVEKILPELVSTNAQGQKAVNYIPIIAFLIEAVKKQQEDIEALKKR